MDIWSILEPGLPDNQATLALSRIISYNFVISRTTSCETIRERKAMQNIKITPQMLSLIAEIETFKGAWDASVQIRAEQLRALKKVSTIKSIGSSNL